MEPSDWLQNVLLFSALTQESLDRVAAIAQVRSTARGAFLHRQDELGHALWVLLDGEVVLHQTDVRGFQRPIGYLFSGDWTGEASLLFGDPYGAFAQATTDVKALYVDKDAWDVLLRDYPHIQKELVLSPVLRERLKARSYPWPAQDEPPVLLRKRHWIVFAQVLPLPLFAALVLSLGVWLLTSLGVTLSLFLQVLLIGTIPALMIAWFYADWQNDYFLLTTKRLLHREKIILLYETWNEVPLTKIQNTEIRSEFGGRVLGFGTLRVQTAGRGTIVMDHVPDPYGFQQAMYLHHVYLRSRALQEERSQVREQYMRHKGLGDTIPPEMAVPSQPSRQRTVVNPGLLARLFPIQPSEPPDPSLMVVWRKHWAFLLRRILLPSLSVLAILGMITISLLHRGDWYSPSLLLTSLVLWIVAVTWLWWEYEDWRNDIYIVTDRLIIDVEKKPLLFDEQRKQASLDVIQNVSLRQQGLLANLLNYGDVLIQTAGAAGDFTFDNVASPAEVQREVFRRIDAYDEARRRRDKEQKAAELSAWFQIHDEVDHPHDTSPQ